MNNTERATVELIINGAQANASMRDLEAAARKVKSEMRGMLPGTPEFAAASNNLNRINTQLNDVRVQAGLTKSSFEKLKDTVKGVFVGTLGANLAIAGLGKITEYIGNAWNAALKLSDQMSDIGRTTGLTTEEVKALNKELSAINTRTSTNDLREMAIVAGQFGVAKDKIAGFVEAVDRVNIVMGGEFGGNAEAVATEMSKIRNVFTDIKTDNIGADIGFISNAINKLAQDGVATAPVVADLANRIGGYGIQVGLTSGQVLGLSATLQELNVSSERGGTAVVKILQKMLTNTEDFAKIAGMQIGDFKKLLNEDLYGAFAKVMEGSKNMGTSSTLLAGIVKELEVQGAGASEVFAKLGANTELLAQKTDMASQALTNTNSITDQAKEKQENLAGTVAQLGKAWDRLTNNPAIVTFFSGLINLVEGLVEGLNYGVKVLKVYYDFFTNGLNMAEAVKNFRASIKKEADEFYAEVQAKEKSAMETRVAGAANGYKQLSDAELKHQIEKLAAINKGNFNYIKELNAAGKSAEAMLYIQQSKEDVLRYNAALKEHQNRTKNNASTLEQKQELTKEMLKEEDKKNKEIEKLQKAQEKKEEKEEAEKLKRKRAYAKQEVDVEIEKRKMLDEQDDELNKLIKDLENNKFVLGIDSRQNDLLEVQKYYQERLRLAEIYAVDSQKVTEQQNAAENAINQKWDAKELADTQRAKQAELQASRQLFGEVTGLMNMMGQQAAANTEMGKTIALANIAFDTAQAIGALTKHSEVNPANAVTFGAAGALQFAAGLVRIFANIGQAYQVMNGAPQFFEGGFTGKGGMLDNRGGFAAILHPNEYVVNAKALQNPAVSQMVNAIETGQINNITNNTVTNTGSGGNSNAEIKELLLHLINNGVHAEMVFDDERLSKLNRKQTKQQEQDNSLSV